MVESTAQSQIEDADVIAKQESVTAKLDEAARQRQAAKELKDKQKEEEQAPEESFMKIDDHFNKEFEELEVALMAWNTHCVGQSATEVGEYFDQLYERFSKLRDHISQMSYALPNSLTQKYNKGFNAWSDNFAVEKDKAIPKKKFAFVRKTKKTKKAAEEPTSAAATEAEEQKS